MIVFADSGASILEGIIRFTFDNFKMGKIELGLVGLGWLEVQSVGLNFNSLLSELSDKIIGHSDIIILEIFRTF